MNLSFRKATDQDLQLLYEIETHTFIRDFDNIMASIEEFKQFLNESINYLIYLNGIPVGSYMLSKTADGEGEIFGITILPTYQKKSIGTNTLKKVLNDLKKKYKKIKVVAHPKNIAAKKLYEKFGFKIFEEKENYYGDGQPRLIYYLSFN